MTPLDDIVNIRVTHRYGADLQITAAMDRTTPCLTEGIDKKKEHVGMTRSDSEVEEVFGVPAKKEGNQSQAVVSHHLASNNCTLSAEDKQDGKCSDKGNPSVSSTSIQSNLEQDCPQNDFEKEPGEPSAEEDKKIDEGPGTTSSTQSWEESTDIRTSDYEKENAPGDYENNNGERTGIVAAGVTRKDERLGNAALSGGTHTVTSRTGPPIAAQTVKQEENNQSPYLVAEEICSSFTQFPGTARRRPASDDLDAAEVATDLGPAGTEQAREQSPSLAENRGLQLPRPKEEEDPASSSGNLSVVIEEDTSWDMNHHRTFVATVFEIGLKNCSPSVIMDAMKNLPNHMTREKTKSHLQKFRKIPDRSVAEFLAEYDEFMRIIQAAGAASSAETGIMNTEHDAEHNSSDATKHEDPAVAGKSEQITNQRAKDAAARLQAALRGMEPEELLGGKAVAYSSYAIANGCPIPSNSSQIPYEATAEKCPIVTEKEMETPIGRSLMQVKGALEFVTDFVLKTRHGIPMKLDKKIPPFLKHEDLATVLPRHPSSHNSNGTKNTGDTRDESQETPGGGLASVVQSSGYPQPLVPTGYPLSNPGLQGRPLPSMGHNQNFAGAAPVYHAYGASAIGELSSSGMLPPHAGLTAPGGAGFPYPPMNNTMVPLQYSSTAPYLSNDTMYHPPTFQGTAFPPHPPLHHFAVRPSTMGPYPPPPGYYAPYFPPFHPLPPSALQNPNNSFGVAPPLHHGFQPPLGVALPHHPGYGHPPPAFAQEKSVAVDSTHPSSSAPFIESETTDAHHPQKQPANRQSKATGREILRRDDSESPPQGVHSRNIFDQPPPSPERSSSRPRKKGRSGVKSLKETWSQSPSSRGSTRADERRAREFDRSRPSIGEKPRHPNIFDPSPSIDQRTSSARKRGATWSSQMSVETGRGRSPRKRTRRDQQEPTDRPSSTPSFLLEALGLGPDAGTPISDAGTSPVTLMLRDMCWDPLADDSKDHNPRVSDRSSNHKSSSPPHKHLSFSQGTIQVRSPYSMRRRRDGKLRGSEAATHSQSSSAVDRVVLDFGKAVAAPTLDE